MRHKQIGLIERKRRQKIGILIEIAIMLFVLILDLRGTYKNCICMALLNNNYQLLFMSVERKTEGGE